MPERKRFSEMAGEQLREAGILILVFAPLYKFFKFFEGSNAKTRDLVAALLIGLTCMLAGMEIERRREL